VRRVELAERFQRGGEARDADGETGRRHRLAAKTRHQPVIPPAAADRAEAHDFSLFVGDLGEEFGLVDGAGVIFEAAHDRFIYPNSITPVSGSFAKRSYLKQFVEGFT